ncbi:MAG TPA: hypothetical protein VNO86_06575 [Candidatus Binatia bacterium]|nr:hypothetical protein [Candidatus Binatia bacterium]
MEHTRPSTPIAGRADRTDRSSWRPAEFGTRRARDIADPIVEPVWEGRRVLVHIEPGLLQVVDAEGVVLVSRPAEASTSVAVTEPEDELEAVVAAISAALRAGQAVLDGVLTVQASRSGEGALPGEVAIPTAGELAAQLVFGQRRRREDAAAAPGASAEPIRRPGDLLTFVALDLLALDGEPLLDVPLLERKRLLESVLAEGPLVRRTAYVRLPVEIWLGSWRALGFRSVAYKAANSRYEPGRPNDGWAVAPIPRR